MVTVDDVRAVHARAASEYRARREEAEAAVVTWRWATGPVYGLTPFEPECSHFRRGRPLKTEPKRTAQMDSFGFDRDERLRVVRIGGSRALDQEKFYRWGDAGAVEPPPGFKQEWFVRAGERRSSAVAAPVSLR